MKHNKLMKLGAPMLVSLHVETLGKVALGSLILFIIFWIWLYKLLKTDIWEVWEQLALRSKRHKIIFINFLNKIFKKIIV